jgi:acyl-ACP thioesterase
MILQDEEQCLDFYIREFDRSNFTHVNDTSIGESVSYVMCEDICNLLKKLKNSKQKIKELEEDLYYSYYF